MKNITFIAVLILAGLSFYSCEKDEDNVNNSTKKPPSAPSFNLTKSSLKQFEIGEIEASNVNYTASRYIATIDTTEIEVYRTDNQLFFITPEQLEGQHQLTLFVEGVETVFDIRIEALPDISNPSQYIDQMKTNIFNLSSMDSAISKLEKIEPNTNHLKNKNTLIALRTQFENQLNQLTPSEKEEFARFMKANDAIFNYVPPKIGMDSLNMSKSSLGRLENYMSERIDAKTLTFIAGISAIVGGFGIEFCPTVPKACLIGIAGLATTYSIITKFKSEILTVMDKAIMLNQSRLLNMNLKSFQLDNNSVYKLEIEGNRRTLYHEDVNTSIPVLKSFMEVCDDAESYWNTIKDFTNKVAGIFSEDYVLEGEFPHPKNYSTFQSKWIKETAAFYTVDNISNSNVELVSQNVVNDKLEVSFNNKDTADQSFNFELIYDDGEFRQVTKVSATISSDVKSSCPATFTDPRDQKTYKVVQIGDQCWFAENLRYSGSIPEITINDKSDWTNLTTPAWCYLDNDALNDAIYGKIYNWYAMKNGNICPSGWHIPTESDWSELADSLGGSGIAGGKMKKTSGWRSPNTGATNSSEFSALPGNWAEADFGSSYPLDWLDKWGRFWSSSLSAFNNNSPIMYSLSYADDNLTKSSYTQKSDGYYCRCIKD